MTSTERVMTAVAFNRPDRVPYWDDPWGNFLSGWQRWAGVGPEISTADYYGSDISGEICPDERFFATRAGVVSSDAGYLYRDDGWGWLVREPLTGAVVFSERIARRLPEGMSLDNLRFDAPEAPERYTLIPGLAAAERRAGRCVFAKSGGIYCRTQFLYGEEQLLMDMLLEPERVHELMARVAEFLTTLALENLRLTDAWETGLWICDDMAGVQAPLFSPEMFAEFLLPLYKTMLGKIRAAGCRHIFFHSDGNIMPLLELLLEAGFEGFNPLEPRCGMDLPTLRERFGKRMVLFGGVCNTEILPRGDRREIEFHLRPLLEMARDGGIILGCASIGDDIAPEIYDFYRKLVTKYS